MNINIKKLKSTLDTEDIIFILSKLGCHHIKPKSKYIVAALPNGDNLTAIKVLNNEYLSSYIYTKNEYKVKHPHQDIISCVCYLADYQDRDDGAKYIMNSLGLSNFKIKMAKVKERTFENKKEVPDKVLLDNYLDQYILCDENTCIGELLDAGVSFETQKEFGVCFNPISNRYLIPIYNNEGQLVSCKGRTLDKEYKEKGVPKFTYTENIHNNRYLFGYYRNYFCILEKGYVFVVESEKAVLQAHSMGIFNIVATSKKCISPEQVKLINDLGVPVVLCYDEDVIIEEIKIECRKLNVTTYYTRSDTLPEKSNCFDVGIDKVKEMFKTKIKFKE